MLRCSLWALAAAVQPKARLIADKVGDWLREIFAEPIKLPPGVSELVVDHPYSLDQAKDASRSGLYSAWRNCQSGHA